MGFVSILGFAQQQVKIRVHPGDRVIDATMGNGVDTLFLAELVGPDGEVHAFDIQEAALDNTRKRLAQSKQSMEHVQLHLRSHSEMSKALPEKHQGTISAIMFNFGYLPGADAAVITQTNTSLHALEAAAGLIKPGGIITAVLYPGHQGGQEEAETIEHWASELSHQKWKVLGYRFMNIKTKPPYLLAIEKKHN